MGVEFSLVEVLFPTSTFLKLAWFWFMKWGAGKANRTSIANSEEMTENYKNINEFGALIKRPSRRRYTVEDIDIYIGYIYTYIE